MPLAVFPDMHGSCYLRFLSGLRIGFLNAKAFVPSACMSHVDLARIQELSVAAELMIRYPLWDRVVLPVRTLWR